MKRILFVVFLVIVIFVAGNIGAESLDLAWQPNTEPDISGYSLYYGTESRVYDLPIPVGNVTQYQVEGLTKGKQYYFAVTAIDTSGNESGFSTEFMFSIPSEEEVAEQDVVESPGVSEPSDVMIMGNNTEYSNRVDISNKLFFFGPYTASSSGTLDKLNVYSAYLKSTEEATIGIYSDNSGVPGTKLADTTPFSGTNANGEWIALSLDSPVTVTSGMHYWLAYGTDDVASIKGETISGNIKIYAADSFSYSSGTLPSSPATSLYDGSAEVTFFGSSSSEEEVAEQDVVESPGVSEPSGVMIMGNNTEYSNRVDISNKLFFFGPYTASSSGTLDKLNVYSAYLKSTEEATIGIYSDNSGVPGTKLADTTPFSGTNANGEWIALSLDSPVTVTSGMHYWLAYGTDDVASIKGETISGNIKIYAADSFSYSSGTLPSSPATSLYDGSAEVTFFGSSSSEEEVAEQDVVESPGVSEPSDVMIMGNNTEYSNRVDISNKLFFFGPYTASSSGTLDKLNVYSAYLKSTEEATIGIYSDNSGVPGTKLADTTPFSGTNANGEWIALSLDSPVTVTSGMHYWLAYGTDDVASIKGETISGNIKIYAADSFSYSSGTLPSSPATSLYDGSAEVTFFGSSSSEEEVAEQDVVESPGVSEPSDVMIMGNNTEYSNRVDISNKLFFFGPYTASSSGTLDKLNVYSAYLKSTEEATIGIYSDNSGVPGTKLADTTPFSGTNANGEWIALSLDSPVTVTSGMHYWLAYGTDDVASIKGETISGNIKIYAADSFSYSSGTLPSSPATSLYDGSAEVTFFGSSSLETQTSDEPVDDSTDEEDMLVFADNFDAGTFD